MPEIIQHLKLKSDPSTIVRPNVVSSNIPANAIKTAHIEDGAITTGKIANEAITAAKLGPECVLRDNIAPASIGPAKLEASAVTETKIGAGAVTESKIGARAVTLAKLNLVNLYDAEILSRFPTLSDFWAFVLSNRYNGINFYGTSGAELCAPLRWLIDLNSEVIYIEYYDDNNAAFVMKKIQTDSDYITFITTYKIHFVFME